MLFQCTLQYMKLISDDIYKTIKMFFLNGIPDKFK